MIDVVCEKCDNVFESKVIIKQLEGDIQVEMLQCPECKAEYPILKTNALIRDLRGSDLNKADSGTREKLKEEMRKLNNN